MNMDEELDRFKDKDYHHSETLEKSLDSDRMIILTVCVPKTMVKQLDNIVERTGLFANRAEAMRSAFRDLIVKYSTEHNGKNGRPKIRRMDYND